METRRITGLLATNIFLAGAASAAMMPYRAIVGVETLGLTNSQFGLVMALNAVGAAIAAMALGWLSDKMRDRRILLILCAIMGIIAFSLVWAFQTPVVFISVFILLLPFGNALFSQSFSYSRAFLDRVNPGRAELSLSFLRSVFTMAWILVPPVAGWVAAQWSAYSVFAFSAVCAVGSVLVLGILWLVPGSRVGREAKSDGGAADEDLPPIRIAKAHRFGVIGVTLSLSALQLNMILLPLIIVRDLSGTLTQVGISASVGAIIEVPAMIGWGYLALRLRKEMILAAASAIFAAYFALMVFVTNFTQVLVLQSLAAVAIAALLSINISYLQEAIPGRVGLSTSLVDAARVVSVWIAAAIFSMHAAEIYTPLMGVAALTSLCGAILMLGARKVAEGERLRASSTP